MLLEKAAGQGHAYAMFELGNIHDTSKELGDVYDTRKEYDQAVAWYTKGAEAGLPNAMFGLAVCLDKGEGEAAPDYLAVAEWYRRAAESGHEGAANNLCHMYTVGRGR